jgi:DNA-binding transcriptional MerR regulator
MQQLDLFGNRIETKTEEKKPFQKRVAVPNGTGEDYINQVMVIAEDFAAEPGESTSAASNVTDIPGAITNERKNFENKPGTLTESIIFNDGKIGIKIKSRVPVADTKAPARIERINKVIKPEQKRGRKSFKEMDAEVDLIEVPEDEVLFQKQYYAISQVAEWFKVNTSLIRFWENEFDVLKPKKNRKGDRLFRPEDVKNLHLIYHLLRQRKYTIDGAKEFMRTNKDKADVQFKLTRSLEKIKGFLLDLKANL